jgi:hypothetical protein
LAKLRIFFRHHQKKSEIPKIFPKNAKDPQKTSVFKKIAKFHKNHKILEVPKNPSENPLSISKIKCIRISKLKLMWHTFEFGPLNLILLSTFSTDQSKNSESL